MTVVSKKIQQVLRTPVKRFDKQEGMRVMRRCGVLDKNGNVRPKYRNVVVKTDEAAS